MTALHVLYLATALGAIAFFAAGAAAATLRRRAPAERAEAAPPPPPAWPDEPTIPRPRPAAAVRDAELDQLRSTLATRDARIAELQRAVDAAAAAPVELTKIGPGPVSQPAVAPPGEAERLAKQVEQLRGELDPLRRRVARAEAAEQRARGDADRAREQLAEAEASVTRLRGELEQARATALGARRDAETAEARATDLTRELAERTASARALSTEAERLKGRLRDAEALRAEDLRRRTAEHETDYLRAEVARLEQELRVLRVHGVPTPLTRTARGTGSRAPKSAQQTIGESLAGVLDRFADAGTRSIAVADPLGFPLAANGREGVALAAYAALLLESANRAGQLLPVAAPAAVELVDERGARVSLWTFEVESERLVLANLAVAPVERARVDATLADLATILAPTQIARGSAP